MPVPKHKEGRKQTNRRLLGTLIGFAFLSCMLLVRLAVVQVFNSEFYQAKAIGQWTSDTMVAAKRGRIVDEKGIPLAQSITAQTVIAKPNLIPVEKREDTARKLADKLQLNYEDVLKKISDKNISYVNIKRQISDEEFVSIQELRLPGVNFTVEPKRSYPRLELAEQLLGYTDIDGKGQEGLEARYDKYLSGTPGRTINEIDSAGRTIENGASQPITAVNGAQVKLTIDAVVQLFLENALKDCYTVNNAKSVQGIVMNCKTGAILGMATLPSFDLNAPPRHDLESLRALSRNRVIADAYEPGSTFKIITLAAGLEAGVTKESDHFSCNGGRTIDGEFIKCWSRNHKASQTLAEGVQNSCNPVFMDIAGRLGTDRFYQAIENFGFGQLTNVKLTGEAGGIVRNPKQIRNVDLARIGFGQSIAVTPIQLATAVSACVNGGKLMQPYVVSEIVGEDGTVLEKNEPTVVREVLSEQTSKLVASMLEGVVRDGSGRNCYIPGYHVGGKTGTAQKYENGRIAQGKNVASFIGFAPADDPQFLVLVVVDEPNIRSQVFGSTVAAPTVRSVLYDTLRQYNVVPRYDESEDGTHTDVKVPDLRGLSFDEAKHVLQENHLSYEADGVGNVINQAPFPDAIVPEKSGILLYMSMPEVDEAETMEPIVVPNLTHKNLASAYSELDELGLRIEAKGDKLGRVVLQEPGYGARLTPGATVEVTLRNAYDGN